MSHGINRQFKLAMRPQGVPTRENWEFCEVPIPEPGEHEFLVKILYISLDPAMRGWMNAGKSYIEAVEIGSVMRAGTVGEVIASNHAQFSVGDFVCGTQGVQAYAVSNGKGVIKVDPSIAPLPLYLSTLGMPGMTAYFGLLEIGQPKAGETVVVSGGAGAVGALVGQIAKIQGCHVTGIAGGETKCRYMVETLGFDAAIDYKHDDVRQQLKSHCPEGVDVYFDNVGGDILDNILTQIKRHARIVICGAISQYNAPQMQGPKYYLSLLVNRARMEGFVVFDYASRYQEAAQVMGSWLAKGQLKSKEHIVEGLETFPETLLKLFTGENFGKLIIQV